VKKIDSAEIHGRGIADQLFYIYTLILQFATKKEVLLLEKFECIYTGKVPKEKVGAIWVRF